jgi:hypothetical protein
MSLCDAHTWPIYLDQFTLASALNIPQVFFYENLAGIRAHPDAAAFDHVIIKPRPAKGPTL